jgi:hypothetical protein
MLYHGPSLLNGGRPARLKPAGQAKNNGPVDRQGRVKVGDAAL